MEIPFESDRQPLNGGAYNALLNTTSKFRASPPACLTMLSYMATAVISAKLARHYAGTLWSALPPPTRAPWLSVLAGIAAVLVALVGTAVMDPSYVGIFLQYFLLATVIIILGRIANLNKVLLYIRENEYTNRLKIVTVIQDSAEVPPDFKKNLEFLDEAYPSIDIEFVMLQGRFSPDLIKELSERWKIPTNLMFIGSPGDHFMYGLAKLGGVRLII